MAEPIMVKPMVADEEVVIVIAKESVDKTIIIVIVVVVIVLTTEDNNYIVYPLHVAVVAVANDDLHVFVLFVVEDREDVKVAIIIEIIEGQGGTSPHDQSHHRHHSGYCEQQKNALHTN